MDNVEKDVEPVFALCRQLDPPATFPLERKLSWSEKPGLYRLPPRIRGTIRWQCA
jgi:hypothetical protein